MLLASTLISRPLHCPDQHMGEPTPKTSTLLIPLPDLCPSVEKDGAGGDESQVDVGPSAPVLLRPRTANSSAPVGPNNTLEGDLLKHSKAASNGPSGVVASSVVGSNEGGDDETRSNDSPTKVVTTINTSHGGVPKANTPSSDDDNDEVAVREEEDEGNINKEEESGSQSQRQGPSPSSSFLTPTKLPLPSALKKKKSSTPASLLSPEGSAKSNKGRNYRTRRRIRGIWGEDDDNQSPFSELHDETLLLIMKHLSMKDLLIASMVCQRWKHVSLHQDSWKRIDATDFVKAAYDHHAAGSNAPADAAVVGRSAAAAAAPKSTSLDLAARLEKNSPLVLEIRSIQHRLSADNFLSSLPSLQELTLTSFDELTDTHIHVLLLSSSCKNAQARSKRSCTLKKLVLEQCPRLTNASIQSIGKFCPELEELSLKCNPHITDLSPLNELWHLVKKPPKLIAQPTVPAARPSPPSSLAAMAMLFGGPPPPPPPAAALPTPSSPPPPPRPSTPTNSLQSLFAPPGQSPPRTTANVISILPRALHSRGGSTMDQGKLKRIDVSNTGVSAKSLLEGWKKTIPPSKCVRLEQLILEGTGESWTDALLQELAETLDLPKLQSLNIGCSGSSSNSTSLLGTRSSTSRVTDKGLRNLLLLGQDFSLLSLKHLNLSGYAALSGKGLGEVITASASTLEELVLDDCKGISSKSSNTANDFASCDALAKAILKCTTLDHTKNRMNTTTTTLKNKEHSSNNSNGGLRRISLSRCFSDQTKLQRNNNLQMHEETLGNYLLEAMGPPKAKKKKKKANNTSTTSDLTSTCTTPTTTAIGTLQELDLTDCWFVTSADIASLRKRCPRLEQIHLKGTRADPAAS